LQNLVPDLLDVLAAFSALACTAERFTQATHAGHAILYGTADLTIGHSFADTDIHRLNNSGKNITELNVI
jgi:hypothetical protein